MMIADPRIFDLTSAPLRDLNQALHDLTPDNLESDVERFSSENRAPLFGNRSSMRHWRVLNPAGRHAIACGLDAPVTVEIEGHAGYYCAGHNKQATVIVHGNAGVGVAENMMSGLVHVKGDASQSAGASAHGGMLVIDGSAGARCGISLKGADIVVRGSVGHMSAFMAQAGTMIVFGDAGEALGDSLYEARLFVRGSVASLGADCIRKKLGDKSKALLYEKLGAAGLAGQIDVSEFTRYGSARNLYHFHVDNAGAY